MTIKASVDTVPHAELSVNAQQHNDRSQPPMKPKDSATLIIVDRTGPAPKILMGRRHMRHRFMPGKYVFPGGRLDAADRHVPFANDLNPGVLEKLMHSPRNGKSIGTMRGLGMCAIRETYEEAGLFIGTSEPAPRRLHEDWQAFEERGLMPVLEPLRLVARAITPPGRTRRFDTRFFAVDAEHIVDRLPDGTGPSGELEDLHWLTIEAAHELDLPRITQEILHELDLRLQADPDFTPHLPTPFFYMKGKHMVRGEF